MADNLIHVAKNQVIDINKPYYGESKKYAQQIADRYSVFFDRQSQIAKNLADSNTNNFITDLTELKKSLQQQEKKVFSFLLDAEATEDSAENLKRLREKIQDVMTEETKEDLAKISSEGLNDRSLGEYISLLITSTQYKKTNEKLDTDKDIDMGRIIQQIFKEYNFADEGDKINLEKRKPPQRRKLTKRDMLRRQQASQGERERHTEKIAYTEAYNKIVPMIHNYLNKETLDKLTTKQYYDLFKQILTDKKINTKVSSFKIEGKGKTLYFLSDEVDVELEDFPLFEKEKVASTNPVIDIVNNLNGQTDFKTKKSVKQLNKWYSSKNLDYSQLNDNTLIRINVAIKDWLFSGFGLKSPVAKNWFDKLISKHPTFFISSSPSSVIGNLGELYALAIFSEILGERAKDRVMGGGSLIYDEGFKKGKQITTDMFLEFGAENNKAQNIGIQIKHFLSDNLQRRTIKFIDSKTIPRLFKEELGNVEYPYKAMEKTFAGYLVNDKLHRSGELKGIFDLGREMDIFFSYFAQSILNISLLAEAQEGFLTTKNVGNLFFLYELNYFIPASVVIQSIIDNLSSVSQFKSRVLHASNTTEFKKEAIDSGGTKKQKDLTKEEIQTTNLVSIATVSLNYSFVKDYIRDFNIL